MLPPRSAGPGERQVWIGDSIGMLATIPLMAMSVANRLIPLSDRPGLGAPGVRRP